MLRGKVVPVLGLVLLLAAPRPGSACSICGAALRQAPTIRQEAALPTARIVVVGTVHDVRDHAGRPGPASELHVTHVLRDDPFLAGKKVIPLNNYVPSNEKNPPRFLVFCDVFKNQFDPFRGIPVRSDAGVEYAKKVLALNPKDTVANLAFYFRNLEHADKEIAGDAFIEFAKASDKDVALAAARFDPARLRSWLDNPQTAPERLAVYALLLGLCGRDEDAGYLRKLLDDSSDRVVNAYAGILGGYTRLRPREGWELTLNLLRDSRKPVTVRLEAARTLRFFHGWQPRESRDNLLRCLSVMLAQSDLADLAVEDLRLWQMWDLTREVLVLYGKKGYDAPLMQQAILRYALACNDASCRTFLDQRRRVEPDAVREVEDQLRLDK
jgi:hypothetical protein